MNEKTAPELAAPTESTSTAEPPEHRPFRSWALQQDLISLIGADADWRARSPDIGIESEPERNAEEVRGQRYLREALQPDPRFPVRIKTSIALWTAALLTDAFNQVGPIGISMSSGAFTVTILSVIFALIFTIIVYPRLSPRPFAVVEQLVLIGAYALIAYQCADTGGPESPYIIWYVFTVFYAAYLLPERRALLNVGISVSAGLATALMDGGQGGAYTTLWLGTFAIISILIAGTLLRQRRLEANVARAVSYLALADPLTGVANLRAFEQFAKQIESRGGSRYALAMVDMNGLKGANTVFGHETGDGMIVRLARLLLSSSDPEWQVARIGGDEFVVIVPDAGKRELEEWQLRFSSMVEQHNARIRGRLPQISVAVGIAASPDDGASVDDLLDQADHRMYDQKTPAVTPPYEIDGHSAPGGGNLLRSARFANAPKHTYTLSDILPHAAVNWTIIGLLTLATLSLDSDMIVDWLVIAAGIYSFVIAGMCLWLSRSTPNFGLMAVSDVSTVLYSGLLLIATGYAESPIQLAVLAPVAFYAQYFAVPYARVRIALVTIIWAIAFWAGGDISASEQTLFAVLLTAIIVIATILQLSLRSMDQSMDIVRDSATHDPLTKILNLHAFRDDLQRAIKRSRSDDAGVLRPALAIADIDEFRNINTLAGHRGGDQILVTAVERLVTEVGDAGKVYRIGGDEFAILFEVERLSDAQALADRFRRALEFRSRQMPADQQRLTSTVGFAVWHDGLTPESFVESVETVLAQNKADRGRTIPAGTNVML